MQEFIRFESFVGSLRAGGFLFIFCLVGFWPSAFAQWTVKGIVPHEAKWQATGSKNKYQNGRFARLTSDSTTLKLPFFEDFSKYLGRPDSALWQQEGGVYVSRGMAVRPPSLHTAFFDGLDALGRPYEVINVANEGGGDTLTSRFIDLKDFDVNDAIYLSFFWQQSGLGERSDTTDYLELQFKDRDNKWVRQWRQPGGRLPLDFNKVLLPITDAKFMHTYFQFRFVSRGRRSGAFDVWNLDYIVMDLNRNPEADFRLDLACSKIPEHFLKSYSAMPYAHFLADTLTHKRDSISTTINNFNNLFNVIAYECKIIDADSRKLIHTVFDSAYSVTEQGQQIFMPSATIARRLPTNLKKLNLLYRFEVKTNDRSSPVDYQSNDTISSHTVFDNYYAYDDGSAEFAAGINQKFGRIAYQYVLARQDTLTDIDVSFMRVGRDVSGQNYRIFVWKKLDFSPNRPRDSVLHVQNASFQYADSINTFSRIRLSESVVVSDTFFIGFQQLYEDMLPLGLDRNTESGERMYYNVTNSWQKNNTIKGSFLLRPVFQKFDPTGFLDWDDKAKNVLRVYPNPAQEQIRIDASCSYWRIRNILGQIVAEEGGQVGNSQLINVSSLSSGLYSVELVQKGQSLFGKFMVE